MNPDTCNHGKPWAERCEACDARTDTGAQIAELRAELAVHARVADVALRAIKYTLDRVRSDVDFFYVMDLTETSARLCEAFSELAGMPLEEVRHNVQTPLFPDQAEATIEKLRRRIAEFES